MNQGAQSLMTASSMKSSHLIFDGVCRERCPHSGFGDSDCSISSYHVIMSSSYVRSRRGHPQHQLGNLIIPHLTLILRSSFSEHLGGEKTIPTVS